MLYLLLKFAHLTAAAFFIGGVFFEVMILSRTAHRHCRMQPRPASHARWASAPGKSMHWVILVLYAAGLGLAWHYRAALHAPLASSFGILLSLKIILALSILGHFLLVVFLMRNGRMTAPRSRRIHLGVLLRMLAILFLAKAMFLLNL